MLAEITKEVVQIAEAGKVKPRVHGNGFIQLDLSMRRRLHIFGDPDIPHQRVPIPIHDHTFSFTSWIMKGSLTNLTMDFIFCEPRYGGATHLEHMARVRRNEDTILVPTDRYGRVSLMQATNYWPCEKYSMQAGVFHETVAHGPTVTVIYKDGMTLAQGGPAPRVLVPNGFEPDNVFNRYQLAEEELWRIIYRHLT